MSVSYTTRFYNFTAPLYDIAVDWAYRKGRLILEATLQKHPGGNLLEMGAGTGLNAAYIPNHFNYNGIDISTAMLNKARKKHPEQQFYLMNAEQTRFDNHIFDVVILSHVLTVTESPTKMIKEASRVLRPNGHLIIMNSLNRSDNKTTKPIKQLLALKSISLPPWKKLGFQMITKTHYGHRNQLSFLHLHKI